MLSASLAADTGLKLEVNSKILDSCTGLMAAIQQLVIKSKLLQAEILAKGKVMHHTIPSQPISFVSAARFPN